MVLVRGFFMSLATPRSASFTTPCLLHMMFCGLMSLRQGSEKRWWGCHPLPAARDGLCLMSLRQSNTKRCWDSHPLPAYMMVCGLTSLRQGSMGP
jgi:hypothetical protein